VSNENEYCELNAVYVRGQFKLNIEIEVRKFISTV